MEEFEIGSEITLKVVDGNGCEGCFFADLDYDIYVDVCKRIKCSADKRKDKKDVKFVRVN